ncbi:MAG: hypothetical protein ACMXYG_04435 [Candidatus Woesearchaeota archaeon]
MTNVENKIVEVLELLTTGKDVDDSLDDKVISDTDDVNNEPVLLPYKKPSLFSLGLQKVQELSKLTQNASYKRWLNDRGIEIIYSKVGESDYQRNYGPPVISVRGKSFYDRFRLDYTSCGRIKENIRGDKYCFDIFNPENKLLKSAVVVVDSDGNNYSVFYGDSNVDNIPMPLLPNSIVPYLDSKPLSFVDSHWIGNTILGVNAVYSDVSKNKYKIPLRFFLSHTNGIVKIQFDGLSSAKTFIEKNLG